MLDGNGNMQDLEKALARYIDILNTSSSRTATANDRHFYTQHLAAAALMFASFHAESPIADLKRHVADERRTYGWGFLSGEDGSAAEKAFDDFAKMVEAV